MQKQQEKQPLSVQRKNKKGGKKMKVINLTPHSIVLISDSMNTEIKPSGLARCKVTTEKVGEVNGFPVNKNTYSQVVGLPEPEKDTIYIVSAIVAKAVSGKREDCIVVDQTVRNEQGQIIGCKGFAII